MARRTHNSSVFVTEPSNPDSDGDGLSDGGEAGALVSDAQYGMSYRGI